MTVEQAIFTSAKTDRAVGYQVIARSAGVREIDVRELAIWCPSHDSLLEQGADAVSFNFHPMPSGAYCISRTAPAGWEYSGRGGIRVYTHCLLVPQDTLARFANNPFGVLHAAMALGAMEVRDSIPARLERLSLAGGAAGVDQPLLARLRDRPGSREMAVLVQSALSAVCLAVASQCPIPELFAGLMSCLPPEMRVEFSFSTGLKFSGRRPFHLLALSGDPGEQRWVAHQNNVTVLDLSGRKPLPSIPMDGWARFIERVLATGHTEFLAAQLSKRRFDLKIEDLPALGLQLLEDLESSSFADVDESAQGQENDTGLDSLSLSMRDGVSRHDPAGPVDQGGSDVFSASAGEIQQAHAAHCRFQKTQVRAENQAAGVAVETPSACLHPDSPEVLEKLELLDDLVYDAISGRPGALGQLQDVWPAIRVELGDHLLAESREQYLRYALTIWENCVEHDQVRNATKAVQALDVLCLLFEE